VVWLVEMFRYLLDGMIFDVSSVVVGSVGSFSVSFSYIEGGTFEAGYEVYDVDTLAGVLAMDFVADFVDVDDVC
jgi:hypothetical protein